MEPSPAPPPLPRNAPWRLLGMLALTAGVAWAAWVEFGRTELLWITAGLAVGLGWMGLGHILMRRRATRSPSVPAGSESGPSA